MTWHWFIYYLPDGCCVSAVFLSAKHMQPGKKAFVSFRQLPNPHNHHRTLRTVWFKRTYRGWFSLVSFALSKLSQKLWFLLIIAVPHLEHLSVFLHTYIMEVELCLLCHFRRCPLWLRSVLLWLVLCSSVLLPQPCFNRFFIDHWSCTFFPFM